MTESPPNSPERIHYLLTAHVIERGHAPDVAALARLAGCSLGGSFLKLRSVHVGFRLEFATDRGFIITSPVSGVTVAAPIADSNDIM